MIMSLMQEFTMGFFTQRTCQHVWGFQFLLGPPFSETKVKLCNPTPSPMEEEISIVIAFSNVPLDGVGIHFQYGSDTAMQILAKDSTE